MKQHIWVKALPDNVVLTIATLGPIGNIKKAPGTWGTFAGIIWFSLVYWNLDLLGILVFSSVSIYLAIQICWEAEIRLKMRDPGKIVLDEFVAIPLCFIGAPRLLHSEIAWIVVLLVFLFFRLFDIWKPFGIKKLQNYPGGIGVVVDDLAAALLTAAVLYLLASFAVSAGYIGYIETIK
ncbi:MAG: phosphatidylglycerophosphatase A [Verrucomicrobia bacterium]|nr:phosphatidylglycerophosphatase A [Verrucomicrobiota bacterium]